MTTFIPETTYIQHLSGFHVSVSLSNLSSYHPPLHHTLRSTPLSMSLPSPMELVFFPCPSRSFFPVIMHGVSLLWPRVEFRSAYFVFSMHRRAHLVENIETVRRACISFVVIQVEEYVIIDDETQLSEKLVNQINSSSRFIVDNKHLKPTVGPVWIYMFFFFCNTIPCYAGLLLFCLRA